MAKKDKEEESGEDVGGGEGDDREGEGEVIVDNGGLGLLLDDK